MNQNEKDLSLKPEKSRSVQFGGPRRPREADLEKAYEKDFQEYEEWRSAQVDIPADEGETKKVAPKKKHGFGRMDLIFIVLGFLVALLWRGCSPPK